MEAQKKTEEIMERAMWFLRSGEQFKNAFFILIGKFSAVTGTWNYEVERPSYYCAGFAIENFLKSYLTIRRIDFQSNHKGHDLKKLISQDKKEIMHFFKFNDADIFQINMLNERYYNHGSYGKDDLRYPTKSGMRKSPHPDNLNTIIFKMHKKLMSGIPEIRTALR